MNRTRKNPLPLGKGCLAMDSSPEMTPAADRTTAVPVRPTGLPTMGHPFRDLSTADRQLSLPLP